MLRLTNLNPSDVSFSRSGVHAYMTVTATGHVVTLDDQFFSTTSNYGIERIEFANGTTWDRAAITAAARIVGTPGDDVLPGTSGNDIFDGGLGNDRFNSGPGSDTYIYRNGDGNDYIDDESSSTTEIDVLKLTNLNPSDVTFTRSGVHAYMTVTATGHVVTLDDQFYSTTSNYGIEQIQFANGTTWDRAQIKSASWLRGGSGNDTITGTSDADKIDGGPGNDNLTGDAGSDTFAFHAGFGKDIITDFVAGAGSVDVIEFDTSIFATYAALAAAATQSGADTLITVDAGNTLTLKNVSLSGLHSDDFRFV